MTRILVVDDHPIIRSGLVTLLNRQTDMEACGEADSERSAEAAIAKTRPDIVLLDLVLTHSDGIETIKKWHALYPDLKILVLSAQDETVFAQRVLDAGGRGFIMKRQAAEEMFVAIRAVRDGGTYVSRQVAARRRGEALGPEGSMPPDIAKLTNRELHILQLIGSRLANREIAAECKLSVKTIESHRENLKNKLDLNSAPELLARAIRWVQEGK